MPRKSILIEITPHRFDAAIMCGDDIVARLDAPSQFDDKSDSLDALLDHAKKTLVAFVSKHGLKNVKATVLYSSSSASFGVFSYPASIGLSKALQAATLALEEAAGFPLADNPYDASRISTDAPDASPDSGSSQMTHVFGITDSGAVTDQLCQWVSDCGLRVEAILPAKAISMLSSAQAAMTPASETTRIVLHMSDDNAVLAASHNGALKFVRTIGVDTRAFLEAMTGDIKPSSAAGSTIQLTHRQATTLLFEEGIPKSGCAFDAGRGISANDILPLLQPILQRCVVETKQSIRFGLSNDEREHALFAMTGTGARIPGLAELIARQTGITMDTGIAAESGSGSSLESYAALDRTPRGLVSASVRGHRKLRRLQIAMALGLCAGVVLLGLDAFITKSQIGEVRLASQKLEDRLTTSRPAQHASQRLSHSEALIAKANQSFAHVARGQTRWDAVLTLLSMTASEHFTFSRLHMSQDEGRPICSLSGEIRADSESAARNAFAGLIAALSDSPIVEHCSIASTAKDRSDFGVQRFELRLTLRESVRSTIVQAQDDTTTEFGIGGQP